MGLIRYYCDPLIFVLFRTQNAYLVTITHGQLITICTYTQTHVRACCDVDMSHSVTLYDHILMMRVIVVDPNTLR